MRFIIKTIGVFLEVLLMLTTVLAIPVWYAITSYYYIRYGFDDIRSVWSDAMEILQSLWGNIKDIVALH